MNNEGGLDPIGTQPTDKGRSLTSNPSPKVEPLDSPPKTPAISSGKLKELAAALPAKESQLVITTKPITAAINKKWWQRIELAVPIGILASTTMTLESALIIGIPVIIGGSIYLMRIPRSTVSKSD